MKHLVSTFLLLLVLNGGFGQVQYQKSLNSGWNWFSVNIVTADMSLNNLLSSLTLTEGDYVKSQTLSATYFDGFGWFGDLAELSVLETYKIKLFIGNTLLFKGQAADPLSNPIPISSGWNWIGYVPQGIMAITEALVSINPVENDYLKSQIISATFFDGFGWFGDLTEMIPGEGYMLKCPHEEMLIYPGEPVCSFIDGRDGHVYKCVEIGSQTWMAENLAWLPDVSPSSEASDTDPYYYVFDYEGENVSEAKVTENYTLYGAFYNWPASLTACPAGWHLPSDEEWTILTDYLESNGYGYGGSGVDLGKSVASTSGWSSALVSGYVGNDQASNNSSGFNAFPVGARHYYGGYYHHGDYAHFWSSSPYESSYAWERILYYDFDEGYYYRRNGFSIRCLEN